MCDRQFGLDGTTARVLQIAGFKSWIVPITREDITWAPGVLLPTSPRAMRCKRCIVVPVRQRTRVRLSLNASIRLN